MIRLHQGPAIWGLPNVSPACMKLETWFRMAGVPYEAAPVDIQHAPKGKIPWIEEGDVRMGDSTLIVEHLRHRGEDPDRHLSTMERAISVAVRRMLKEHLYWVMVQARYREPDNWSTYGKLLSGLLAPGAPEPEQLRIAEAFKEEQLGQMRGHGMGRHRAEEIYRLGMADLGAVSDLLGDKPFLFGDTPSTADATLYAYASNLLFTPLRDPLAERGFSRQNLVAHSVRMKTRFFPGL